MISRILIFFFLSASCSLIQAQIHITDSRDMQMGNSSVACIPGYGLSKNIAFVDENAKSYICMNVINKYSIKEFSPILLSYINSFNSRTSISAGICKTGTENYSEQFAEIGIAKRLGEKFYAGIKLQYYLWSLNENNYEKSHALVPSAGFYTKPLKYLSFGVIVRNPVRSRMNAIETNRMPAQINPGISIAVSEKIKLACSVLQENNQQLSTQFGAEYFFHPELIFRCGWQTLPVSQSFGFALVTKWMITDLGIQTHPTLGNSYSFALSFPI